MLTHNLYKHTLTSFNSGSSTGDDLYSSTTENEKGQLLLSCLSDNWKKGFFHVLLEDKTRHTENKLSVGT